MEYRFIRRSTREMFVPECRQKVSRILLGYVEMGQVEMGRGSVGHPDFQGRLLG